MLRHDSSCHPRGTSLSNRKSNLSLYQMKVKEKNKISIAIKTYLETIINYKLLKFRNCSEQSCAQSCSHHKPNKQVSAVTSYLKKKGTSKCETSR